MSKKKNKNASSFLSISNIENGFTIDKVKIPKLAFERFDFFKTDIMKVDTKNVFVVDPEVSKMLDMKMRQK